MIRCLLSLWTRRQMLRIIYLKETLYLIFDYPYKYYTFKLFEV